MAAIALRPRSVALALLLAARAADGQPVWEPPAELSVPSHHRATERRPAVTTLRIADFSIALEETPLSAVQSNVGGTIGRRGDASDALAWLCYHGGDGDGAWALWLESGEIHGGTVGAFQLRRVNPSADFDPRCHAVNGSRAGLDLGGRLRLGLSMAETTRMIGRPTASAGTTWRYLHERSVTSGGERGIASTALTLHFRHAMVDAIDCWKMTVF
jgi:hypothetical protein